MLASPGVGKQYFPRSLNKRQEDNSNNNTIFCTLPSHDDRSPNNDSSFTNTSHEPSQLAIFTYEHTYIIYITSNTTMSMTTPPQHNALSTRRRHIRRRRLHCHYPSVVFALLLVWRFYVAKLDCRIRLGGDIFTNSFTKIFHVIPFDMRTPTARDYFADGVIDKRLLFVAS